MAPELIKLVKNRCKDIDNETKQWTYAATWHYFSKFKKPFWYLLLVDYLGFAFFRRFWKPLKKKFEIERNSQIIVPFGTPPVRMRMKVDGVIALQNYDDGTDVEYFPFFRNWKNKERIREAESMVKTLTVKDLIQTKEVA